MNQRDAATEAQVRASHPLRSTWLAANAGSGKTRVLTDRVARLLLNGVQPQQILCLTYTKAAANEMQNRLFARLGEWAMLSDPRLQAALFELGIDDRISAQHLRKARTLFARAIETPGGLKIQTVHSFCAGLLRRFPLEAGVSPQFKEIEEHAAKLLRIEIYEDMAGGAHAPLLAAVARHLNGEQLNELAATIVRNRTNFYPKRTKSDIFEFLDLPDGFSTKDIEAQLFDGTEKDLFHQFIDVAQKGSKTDIRHVNELKTIEKLDIDAYPALEKIFLYGEYTTAHPPFSAKINRIPSKSVNIDNGFRHDLNNFMKRIEVARDLRLSLETAEMSYDLHQFASVFLTEYDRQKTLRGWLDFDDLILRTQDLLNDPNVAQWVLYRLDEGIDHILVDEAQDTSPAQWNIIEKLSDEFTSGKSARDTTHRSIFVVGDKKQSIYSFQGADPMGFDKMKTHFKNRLHASDQSLNECMLAYSFRSAPAILEIVDRMFNANVNAAFDDQTHIAFKHNLPGRVDLWPNIEETDSDDTHPWYAPVDSIGDTHHFVLLAEAIAQSIKSLIESKTLIPTDTDPRPVRAGDFLILVQSRSTLFTEIIRACKAHQLPIAGADRTKVRAELAVKDVTAVLSFLTTPADDLSLAAALRSPLFGLSEQDLFDIAHRRLPNATLWSSLEAHSERFSAALGILKDLKDNRNFLQPYDLIERILTRHKGRQRLLGRLGPEAEDGIDALLSQALVYEHTEIPSLTGFLAWMDVEDLEVKRQIDNKSDLIRVMTVHGAKGLEAPIVILPDTAKRRGSRPNMFIKVDDVPLWRSAKDKTAKKVMTAVKDEEEKIEAERLRLLYVAATRAEKWLIVAAAGRLDTKGNNSWYQRFRQAFPEDDTVPHEFSLGEGLRYETGDWANLTAKIVTEEKKQAYPLLDTFTRCAPKPKPGRNIISPSKLSGSKVILDESQQETDAIDGIKEAAMNRGDQIHKLLEHLPGLPSNQRQSVARSILNRDLHDIHPLLSEVIGILDNPEFKEIFNEAALTEVPIVAAYEHGTLIGQIDRLVIKKDQILAIDYKTNHVIPNAPEDIPDGLLKQMAAYAHALSLIFPKHIIHSAILWTASSILMHLPSNLLEQTRRDIDHLSEINSVTR